MGKSDDAIARRRKKKERKRLGRSESEVSARVAAVLAAKRRRKAGTRRMCEGMCFSAPTLEDPFNDRFDKKSKQPQAAPKEEKKKDKNKKNKKQQKPKKSVCNGRGDVLREDESYKSSMCLFMCLNAIRDGWRMAGESGTEGPLSIEAWGAQLMQCLAGKSNVIDSSGEFATREQVAWVAAAAADVILQKEKSGSTFKCPFLLYLVPSQEKALEVRSICKLLKTVGIHSISVHPGVSIDHQVNGLKACEPEFLISTPERLLELVTLKATDISCISFMVVDGLEKFADGQSDVLCSIRSSMSCKPQVIIFGGLCSDRTVKLAPKFLANSLTRLSLSDSVSSQCQFISQNIHCCASSKQKISKVKEILQQMLESCDGGSKTILLITGSTERAKMASLSLQEESYILSGGSENSFYLISSSVEASKLLVKDHESIRLSDLKKIENILLLDFPRMEDYVDVITGMARHSVKGVVHAFLSLEEDGPVVGSLVELLKQCNQIVPESLTNVSSW